MDDIDAQIVSLMEQNARQTSDTIAKQVQVSSATVRRRLKRLLNAKELYIEAFRNPAKAGLPVAALIGLNIEHAQLVEVMTTIQGLEQVSWATTTTGRFDGFVFIRSPSTEHLYLFLKDILLKIIGIRDSETFICLHMEKGSRPR